MKRILPIVLLTLLLSACSSAPSDLKYGHVTMPKGDYHVDWRIHVVDSVDIPKNFAIYSRAHAGAGRIVVETWADPDLSRIEDEIREIFGFYAEQRQLTEKLQRIKENAQ